MPVVCLTRFIDFVYVSIDFEPFEVLFVFVKFQFDFFNIIHEMIYVFCTRRY